MLLYMISLALVTMNQPSSATVKCCYRSPKKVWRRTVRWSSVAFRPAVAGTVAVGYHGEGEVVINHEVMISNATGPMVDSNDK